MDQTTCNRTGAQSLQRRPIISSVCSPLFVLTLALALASSPASGLVLTFAEGPDGEKLSANEALSNSQTLFNAATQEFSQFVDTKPPAFAADIFGFAVLTEPDGTTISDVVLARSSRIPGGGQTFALDFFSDSDSAKTNDDFIMDCQSRIPDCNKLPPNQFWVRELDENDVTKSFFNANGNMQTLPDGIQVIVRSDVLDLPESATALLFATGLAGMIAVIGRRKSMGKNKFLPI